MKSVFYSLFILIKTNVETNGIQSNRSLCKNSRQSRLNVISFDSIFLFNHHIIETVFTRFSIQQNLYTDFQFILLRREHYNV